jgi:hypothetical protein
MKIGIKSFDDWPFIESLQNKADFVEIMAIRGRDYSFIKDIKIPVIIHAMHNGLGINPSDPMKDEVNKKAINFAIDLADKTKAIKIIVHPGPLENSNCTMEVSENFLKQFDDKRIILENHADHRERFPSPSFVTPEQIMPLLKKTKKGFCFDINHAISYALAEKIDISAFLKQFIKLKPAHFHLGGQKFNPYKEHIDFSDSDVDLKKVFAILPEDSEITLECLADVKKTEKDIELIRTFMK